MISQLAHLISTFFYLGYVPKMPGTVTSAVVALLLFFLPTLPFTVSFTLLVVLVFTGIWAAGYTAHQMGIDDPSCIVIDEVIGMCAALLFLHKVWWVYLAAFVVFRILDITKPLFIRSLECLPGGFGIVMDDLAAGLISGAVVLLLACL